MLKFCLSTQSIFTSFVHFQIKINVVIALMPTYPLVEYFVVKFMRQKLNTCVKLITFFSLFEAIHNALIAFFCIFKGAKPVLPKKNCLNVNK